MTIEARLSPGDQLYKTGASGGILVTSDGRYLLQHRDDKPQVWFPDYWGTFGGAIDAGETALETLKREIAEELNFEIKTAKYFTQIAFDFTEQGSNMKYRYYFEVPITDEDVERMVLTEGSEMALFTAEEISTHPMITPYDHMVLRMHIVRDEIVPPGWTD